MYAAVDIGFGSDMEHVLRLLVNIVYVDKVGECESKGSCESKGWAVLGCMLC